MPDPFLKAALFTKPQTKSEMIVNQALKNEPLASQQPNTLLQAAMPLLALIFAIRNTQECSHVTELRNKVIEQIRYFEYRAKKENYSTRCILAARYCLATALDEAVLKTPWGQNSLWVQQGLLMTLHSDTKGGEKFYTILDTMLQRPQDNLPLLDLQYFILSLGFEGRFYNDPEKWNQVRDGLFQVIQHNKQEMSFLLQNKPVLLKSKKRYVLPLWALAIVTSTALLCASWMIENHSVAQAQEAYKLISKVTQHPSHNAVDITFLPSAAQ